MAAALPVGNLKYLILTNHINSFSAILLIRKCSLLFFYVCNYVFITLHYNGIYIPLIVRSNPAHDKVYSIPHYVIKFVSDFLQAGGFHRVLRLVSSTNKTDLHDITELLLKVALNTIILTHSSNPTIIGCFYCRQNGDKLC